MGLRSLRSLRAFGLHVGTLVSDPRTFQIASLSALLLYGLTSLSFEVTPGRVALTLLTCLATQAIGARAAGIRFEWRSALISGLSLCLLLRTLEPLVAITAAVASIGGKFLIRAGSKHVFNPTSFGIVLVLVLFDGAWVSPGQWGSNAIGAFFFACMGSLVVFRAERSDVTWAFLTAHAALAFGRAWWLGDPMSIPIHQLESGSLLLFAFFMISDPKTTPDSRMGRVLFAFAVAGLAYVLRFSFILNNSLLYSLVIVSGAVWLIDRLLPGPRYEWPTVRARDAVGAS
jgi:Na+-transporting NADH:ubiquinone oxidoreductase subunit NqrB